MCLNEFLIIFTILDNCTLMIRIVTGRSALWGRSQLFLPWYVAQGEEIKLVVCTYPSVLPGDMPEMSK